LFGFLCAGCVVGGWFGVGALLEVTVEYYVTIHLPDEEEEEEELADLHFVQVNF
jgi:hypothetical protein